MICNGSWRAAFVAANEGRQVAVLVRVEPRHHREVGWEGRGHRRDGPFEEDPLVGEGIERGRGVTVVAVAAEVVRAEGVHGHEHDARQRLARVRRATRRCDNNHEK